MANLLCDSNINFNSSSWKTIDSTSFLNSEAASTNTTTSYVASSTFTPGAITVEGIMIKYRYVVNNSGTLSVDLYNSTAAATVAGSEVTINVSDLAFWTTAGSDQNGGGFIYLKFATPITLLAATNYAVRVKSSVNGTVSINRNATAGNWSRGLVTSTTASAAVNDVLYFAAPFTTTSTPSFITCTMDNTSSTVFGGIEMGGYSKLILQNNASTNYVLKIKDAGNFLVTLNSEVEFGTLASRVDSTSTFLLEMQASGLATNQIDIRAKAKFTAYGESKTRMTTLAANASAGATTLTTDVSTGWKNGDDIALANTIRSASDLCERKALTANASGTTLTITAITNAKSGTSPTKCDIGNLTSNVKIYGTNITQTFYITNGTLYIPVSTTVNIDNVEFRYMGTNVTNKYGFIIRNTSTAICNIKNCSFSDNSTNAIVIATGGATGGSITILEFEGNVIYNSNGLILDGIPTDASDILKVNNNLIIKSSNYNFYITRWAKSSATLSFDGNILCGGGLYGGCIGADNSATNAVLSNFKIYGGRSYGILIYSALNGITFNNFTIFFNANVGLYTNGNSYFTVDSANIFGNSSYNVQLANGGLHKKTYFRNCTINSNATYTTSAGIQLGAASDKEIIFYNCNIGTSVAHTSADIAYSSPIDVIFNNCTFGSSTIITSLGLYPQVLKVAFQRLNGVAASHRIYKFTGTILNDTVIYNTSPYSQRLVPNVPPYTLSVYKLESTSFQIPVASGSTATVTVKVRKSVIGDGTAYDGAQPRLMLKANPSAGSAYNSDIICATATAASAGAWETLSYTLPVAVTDNVGMEFYVDCDGTTGWVNVDTFISNNNNSMTYYLNGEPIQEVASGGETSFIFLS